MRSHTNLKRALQITKTSGELFFFFNWTLFLLTHHNKKGIYHKEDEYLGFSDFVMVESPPALFLPWLRFFAFLQTCQKNLKEISLGIVSLLFFVFFFSLGAYLKNMAVHFLYILAMPSCLQPFLLFLSWKVAGLVLVACECPYFWMSKWISYQSWHLVFKAVVFGISALL